MADTDSHSLRFWALPIASFLAIVAAFVSARGASAQDFSLGGNLELITEDFLDDQGHLQHQVTGVVPAFNIDGNLGTVPIPLSIALNGRGLDQRPALWNDILNWNNPIIGFQPGFTISALGQSALAGDLHLVIDGLDSINAIINDGPTESTASAGFHISGEFPGIEAPLDLNLGVSFSLQWDALIQSGGQVLLNQDARLRSLDVDKGGTLTIDNGRTLTTTNNGVQLNGQLVLQSSGSTANLNFDGTQQLFGKGEAVFNSATGANVIQSTNGTLTIAPGITIHGGNGTVGNVSQTLINQGLISSDVTGRFINVIGTNWTNSGTLEAKNGGTLNAQGSWSSNGIVRADAGLVNLGGTFSLAGSTLQSLNGGTFVIGGTLNNTANTLTLPSTTGTWQLQGGTILGGAVTGTPGQPLIVNVPGSKLDGVTMNADLLLPHNDTLTITHGLVLNGTAKLDALTFTDPNFPKLFYGSTLAFSGAQSLTGNGSIVFDTPQFGLQPAVQNTITSSGALTIGPGITIHGNSGAVGNASQSLLNQGLISADTNQEAITVTGTNWSNSGTLEAKNGGTLNANGTWTNTNQVVAQAGSFLNANGPSWTNQGSVTANGGTIGLDGQFTNTGTIDAGTGTVVIRGTLDNAGHTLPLTGTTGTWQLQGGTILGGAVTGTPGQPLIVNVPGSKLDGVTMNADLLLPHNDTLTITHGLVLNGTAKLDALTFTDPNFPKLFYGSTLAFSGAQSLTGNGSIVFDTPQFGLQPAVQNTITSSGALTIGPGITIHGNSGAVGNASQSLLNQGLISADTNQEAITVTGTNWSNSGTLEAKNGGTLNANGTWTNTNQVVAQAGSFLNANGPSWTNQGSVTANGGTIGLDGQFTNTGTIDAGTGTVVIRGTLDNAGHTLPLTGTTGTWQLQGGTILGGAVTGTPGQPLIVNVPGSKLDGVTMNADLLLPHNDTLTITHGLVLNGTAKLDALTFTDPNFPKLFYGSTLAFSGAQSLTGNGSIVFDTPQFGLQPAVQNTITSSGALTIGPGITIHGNSGAVGNASQSLLNQGLISADTNQEAITVTGTNWSNSGTLEAKNGGTLNANGTWTQQGIVNVDGQSSFLSSSYVQLGGTTIVDGQLNSTSAIQLLGGTLSGTGTIYGDLVNGGTISPGHSPGTLHIQGNLTQLVTGSLNLEIAGRTPGIQYDQLLGTGTLSLLGNINVTFANGFAPHAGDVFRLLDGWSSATIGAAINFPNLAPGFQYDAEVVNHAFVLTALSDGAVVPEPSSEFLALCGAGLIAAMAWRKRQPNRA